ncbi:hypothetical protein CDAR_462501 [Caerostris darwini]|uniref:Uncharacterized protein n=1 Tax=Caerostris darwini TaxID=1538125 RepID=A0AAV4WRA8_9ARAC|nr:hypothetical protein CDAR_462501 [Caerostris darwini]
MSSGRGHWPQVLHDDQKTLSTGLGITGLTRSCTGPNNLHFSIVQAIHQMNGVSGLKQEPSNVDIHLKTLIPSGTAITMVFAVK